MPEITDNKQTDTKDKLPASAGKKSFFEIVKTAVKKNKNDLKIVGYEFLISFLLYLQLELCNKNYYFNGPVFTFVNIFMVYSLISVLGIFTFKRWISALVTGIASTAVGIVNFYTIQFRNQPVSTMDIQNIKTAANVASSYKFEPKITVIAALVIFALSMFAVFRLKKAEKTKKYTAKKYFSRIVGIFACCFAFYYVFFFASWSIKPKLTLVWSWRESYHQYGFLASSEELLAKSFNVVSKPYGYDEEALFEYTEKQDKTLETKERTPDIIYILNETFFDLKNVISDLKTDKSYMPFIESLDNKIYGYSIVPGCGGGTNRSEYEFLTGNTLELMQGITPFSFLNLNDSPSLVSFLKSKGYQTYATHPAPSLNYSRGTAYPKLGFDLAEFDEAYENAESYGTRGYIKDEEVYKNLIQNYEKMGEEPRFMYALTIQNHGGWEMNDESEDTVRTQNDFGDLTDDVNEYLSCIDLSDSAFEYLVDYYKNCDRDVIICMAGDHCPSFAPDIADEAKTEFEKFGLYATPFVMWANFELEEQNLGYTSLNYLAPLMLKNAGLDLSPFYSFMCGLFEYYPVITSNGVYATGDYELKSYSGPGCDKRIRTYLDMVYNGASKKANRIDALFVSD